jgi:undecaprenyl-diphosphatase
MRSACSGLRALRGARIVAVWFVVGWVLGRPIERRGAVLALLAAGGALLVDQIIIHIWRRPRPFISHPDTVHVRMSRSTDPGFPSDHAAASIAIAVAVLLLHRRLGIVVLAVAALVGYYRCASACATRAMSWREP